MGDRANVKIVGDDGAVYLYTHWGGTELPYDVARVLRDGRRWDDELYLRRLIFSHLVRDDIDGELGYGIGLVPADGDDRVIVVDTTNQTVYATDEWHGRQGDPWTFETFGDVFDAEVRQVEDGWDALFEGRPPALLAALGRS